MQCSGDKTSLIGRWHGQPRPLLIVDDDAALRATLAEQLALDGEFEPLSRHRGGGRAHAVRGADRFDAMLLDIGLPDGDGRELCARLRRQGLKMPIIMLTGADAEADVVRGLDAGANDYIAKPFRLNELLARLRAQLRVFDNSEDAVFPIGPYSSGPPPSCCWNRPQPQDPADREGKRDLKFLYRAGGKPVSRQILLNEVWGYNGAVTTHTLETHIYRLRQKIEPDPSNARLLLTEGGGYRLDPARPGRRLTAPPRPAAIPVGPPRRSSAAGCAGISRSGRHSPG